ncbi:MmcB family DNA repair protein [Novosphingobium sp. YJ-S2-02]|uniref:MmcB family DNA repair protein n=1 Tax=Novosphingobium aureum TaxID=2792964 RepID=A0A931H8X1_9SPHN|nr:MmcB family DNA repair protein [Novosphingobium aureum]MBH0111422.1 MmcB family DNA repair protein [Novosphingobium aureum]
MTSPLARNAANDSLQGHGGDVGQTGSSTAADVVRGVSRLFARNDIWCTPEMMLRNGRRADLMGIDARGQVILVEIKVSRADLLGDGKWTDYLDYCDRFYWALPPSLDRAPLETEAFLPESCGVIVADGYDAEILRPAPLRQMAAARRKVEVERLARTALRRLVVGSDPETQKWDREG